MSIFKKKNKKEPLNFAYYDDGVIDLVNKDGDVIEEDVCMIDKLDCIEFEPNDIIKRKRNMERALRNTLSQWSSNAI
jgi:hypothetical protein